MTIIYLFFVLAHFGNVTGSYVCRWRHTPSYGVTVLLQVHDTYCCNPERQTDTNIKINTLKQLQNQYNIQLWLQKIYIHLTHINLFSIHQCITHRKCINASYIIQHTSHIHQHASTLIFVHHSSISIHYSFIIHPSTSIIHSSTFMHQHSSHGISTHHTCIIPVKRHI